MLLALSMLLSSSITYLLFKALQLYYHTNVRRGDTLAYARKIMENTGDLNTFLILFQRINKDTA